MVLMGKRVEMIQMIGEEERVPTGTKGTVVGVDDIGTIHVEWDNGSTLGIVQGRDQYVVLG